MAVISMPCNKNRTLTFQCDVHLPFAFQWDKFDGDTDAYLNSISPGASVWNSSWGDTNVIIALDKTLESMTGTVKLWLTYEIRIGTTYFTGSGLFWTGDPTGWPGDGTPRTQDVTKDIDGTITITAGPLWCWEDYQCDTPTETSNRGYPVFPYYTRQFGYYWHYDPAWDGGSTTGPLFTNISYWDKTGGENEEEITEVTVGLAFEPFNEGRTANADPGINWTTSFGFDTLQLNTYWPSRPMTLYASCNGYNYNFEGLSFATAMGTAYGNDTGYFSVQATSGEPPNTRPNIKAYGYVYPNNPVSVKGQIALLGSNVWPDSAEYPKVRYRPLWKSHAVPAFDSGGAPYVPFFDDDSLELTAGKLNTTLNLRNYSFDVITNTRYDFLSYTESTKSCLDEWDLGLVLESVSATGNFSWLADAHQNTDDWRVLGQDAWKTLPFKVKHRTLSPVPSSLFIHDNWNWTGELAHSHTSSSLSILAGIIDPLAITANASGWSFSDWRYLRFGCDQPVVVEMQYRTGGFDTDPTVWVWTTHTKRWNVSPNVVKTTLSLETGANLTLQNSGKVDLVDGPYCEIDLVAPSTVSFDRLEYDTSPWSNDKTDSERSDVRNIGQVNTPQDDGLDKFEMNPDNQMSFVPHGMLGVGMIDKFIIWIPANTTTTFNGSLELIAKDPREKDSCTITVNPVFQLSDNLDQFDRWSTYDEDTMSWIQDEDSYWRYHPEGKRMIHGLINYKEHLEAPYAVESEFAFYQTQPTLMQSLIWMWDKNTGQDWEITNKYDVDEDNPLRTNSHYPGLALCINTMVGSTLHHIYDQDVLTTRFQMEARLPADIIRVAPGIGDPQGEYGTYEYTFFKVLGAQVDGLTFKKSTYLPYPNSKVVLTNALSGTSSTITSNDWSYYRSNAVHTSLLDNVYTITSSQMTQPVTGLMWPGRWQWISLMGLLSSSGGVNYLVSPNHRHYRTTTQNGKVVLSLANNTLPLTWVDVSTDIDADTAFMSLKRDRNLTLVIATTHDGSGQYHETTTEGKQFMSTVIFSDATQSCIHISRHHIQYCYAITSTGGLIGQMRDSQNALMREFVVDADVDNVAMSAFESYGARGEWRISVLYSKAGEMRQKVSLDGITYY